METTPPGVNGGYHVSMTSNNREFARAPIQRLSTEERNVMGLRMRRGLVVSAEGGRWKHSVSLGKGGLQKTMP